MIVVIKELLKDFLELKKFSYMKKSLLIDLDEPDDFRLVTYNCLSIN